MVAREGTRYSPTDPSAAPDPVTSESTTGTSHSDSPPSKSVKAPMTSSSAPQDYPDSKVPSRETPARPGLARLESHVSGYSYYGSVDEDSDEPEPVREKGEPMALDKEQQKDIGQKKEVRRATGADMSGLPDDTHYFPPHLRTRKQNAPDLVYRHDILKQGKEDGEALYRTTNDTDRPSRPLDQELERDTSDALRDAIRREIEPQLKRLDDRLAALERDAHTKSVNDVPAAHAKPPRSLAYVLTLVLVVLFLGMVFLYQQTSNMPHGLLKWWLGYA